MSSAGDTAFGARLRGLREERGLSIRDLADKSGLARSHLLYLEGDHKRPGPETLERLAKALKLPLSDLASQEEQDEWRRRMRENFEALLGDDSPLDDDQKERLRELMEQYGSDLP